jgi:hypothetical protein
MRGGYAREPASSSELSAFVPQSADASLSVIVAAKGGDASVSIKAMFGKTGVVIATLVLGLVVVPLTYVAVGYAAFILSFFGVLIGGPLVLFLLVRDGFPKSKK